MRDAALAYVRAGLTITPLCWPVGGGACGAGHASCLAAPRNVGKAPLTRNGHIITFGPGQEDQASNFWQQHPNANIGIRLEESGLIAIDVDDIELLAPEHRALVEQYEHYVISGRGRHIYFRRGELPPTHIRLPGWEIRGKGYIVAPPSRHASGAEYRWSQGRAVIYPHVPDMVADLIRAHQGRQVEDVNIDWDNLPEVDISRIPLSQETRELIRFGAVKGQRSEALWRVIGDLVRAGCDDATIAAIVTNPEHLISEKVLEKTPEQRRKYVEYQIAKMRAEVAAQSAQDPSEPLPQPKEGGPDPTVKTAAEIWETDYPDPSWLVEGVLTEGLTILGGRSKIGKSWLVLDLAVSVALGRPVWGGVPTGQADVLYLSLEDTERRIKSRMASVLKGDPPPDNLYIATTWPRAMVRNGEKVYQPDGIKKLYRFLKENPSVKLVIIDTFAKFRTLWDKNHDIYQRDYYDVGILKELADLLGIAVLLVHHHRKGGADDIGESLNGSVGLPGAADTLWSLTRKGLQGTLTVAGRDVEEKTYVLDFMKDGYWVLRGEKEEAEETDEEREVVSVLEDRGEVTPKELAKELGISEAAAKMRLSRMVKRGVLKRDGRGKYCLAVESEVNSLQEE